jgi:hypothetical protein
MLYGEMMAVYCENHINHIITLCTQNEESVTVFTHV